MKKVLAIVLALMMLIPMALAIVPASAVDAASDSYVDLTAEFNTKSYAVGSGFSIAGTNNAPAKKNANAAAGTYAVLQYAGSADYNKKDYDLSYNVKLGAENKGETMNHLYWQDWGTTNADGNVIRTYASSGKSVGVGLYTTYSGTSITYMILGYAPAGFAVSKALVDGAASKTDTTLLEGASENAELNYNISFDYEAKTATVVVTRVDDATKTITMNFDLTPNEAALAGVTDAQGWAIADWDNGSATALEEINTVKLNDTEVNFVQGFNCKNYAALAGFVANADNPYTVKNTATSGNQVLQYTGAGEYNKKDYEFSYEVELAVGGSTYTHFYWQEWRKLSNGNCRTYASDGHSVGALLNIATVAAAGETPATMNFSVLGYDNSTSGYNAAYKGTKADGSDDLSNTALLAGAEGTVKLRIGYDFDYAAKKLDVVVTRVDDPTLTTNVVFDLTNTFPALELVTDPANVAITDVGSKSVTVGNLVFSKVGIPERVPETELEEGEWAYSTALEANTTDWDIMVPKAINREAFKVENGYFTRTGTDSAEYADAYTMAKYKGFVTEDYKLQYNIKLNADNRCRVAAYLVWDDVDYWGNQKCNGFTFYVRVENGLIYIVGVHYDNQTYRGSMTPTADTAANAAETGEGILAGQPANTELTVTYVVKGDKVSVNVALASDPTKTTGTVIYDLTQYPNALGAADRTEKFGILDAACEYGIAPASIGQIKLWTTSEPPKDTTTGATTTTPNNNNNNNKPADTTASTTAATTAAQTTVEEVEEEKSGCGSSVTVASIAAIATVAVSAVAVTRKRKED